MILALTLSALLPAQETEKRTIGEWKVICENDSQISDGLFDRCSMRKSSDGVTVEVVRTVSGATFRATISGCKLKALVDPVFIPQEVLTAEDGDKMFIGGQVRAIIANNRQCPGRGMTLSVGGAEVPELLTATSKLRKPTN